MPIVPTIKRAVFQGAEPTVVQPGQDGYAALPWTPAEFSQADDDAVFDCTDPTQAKALIAGQYAVSAIIACTDGTQADETVFLQLDVGDGSDYGYFPLDHALADGLPKLSLHCTFSVPVGGIVKVSVQHEHEHPLGFKLEQATVSLIEA